MLRYDSHADIVFYNGQILTVDRDFSIQQAVAIQGDKILAVGSNEVILQLAGDSTTQVDLKGRTVIPGFNDSHHHFMNRAARAYNGIRLDQFTSVPQILDAIVEKARELGPGEIIISNAGCAAELLDEGRTPTIEELDRVAPDNPVVLTFEDGRHTNTRMMELSNITKDIPNPAKGIIGRDPETGELTGVFAGTAQRLLLSKGSSATGDIGVFTEGQLYTAVKWAQRLANSAGITSIRNPSLQPYEMVAYQRLWQNRELTLRVAMDVNVDHVNLSVEELEKELGSWGIRPPFGDEWLRVNGVSELWVDQSTDGMLNSWSYSTLPLAGEGQIGYRGIQRLSCEKLNQICITLNKLGWRPLVHAGGDVAVDILLDAFAAADQVASLKGKRWVVDHAHYGQSRHIERVKEMDLVVAMQYHPYMYYPVFALYHSAERAAHLFPAKDWLDAGIIVAGGSDYSKIPPSPFEGIYFFVTRQTKKWGAIGVEHGVTRAEALRMYTLNSAYLTFEESIKGSIESGKLADLVILSADYLTVSDEDILNLKPMATLVGGKVVYQDADYEVKFPPNLVR
ncbi:amidohydrolase [Limnofasciculus baicalensis]|uniref:Amidohydrolase n=1 Tax=Limnofasciculus baicalensis BBK-W-15 TaxID=2699891 RepID=A0AAE3GVY5_9CYAN|nr:amidohydrolase [Limnofasciculus baicalensis]MCP2730883.1 amidohydrolase [Limnofasciculus baicalensis BBK-W-15]